MTKLLSTNEVYINNIVAGALITTIGYVSLSYIFDTKVFKRYYFLNYMINKKISISKCYHNVEHKTIIDNLKRKIIKVPGVLLLCGFQSSYARNVCNELFDDNKIHGIVDMLNGAYSEQNNDGGSSWFNSNINYEDLLDKNEALSTIFGKNNNITQRRMIINNTIMLYWLNVMDLLQWYQRLFFTKKRYVILFDQFEKNYKCSCDMEKFLTFIVKMAEDAIFYDTYCVLICISDPLIASKIYKKNGGTKISFI